MLTVGFVVTPGFPVMSLAALSVFEFANLRSEPPVYEVTLLSEHGGPVTTSLGATIETQRLGDAAFDTVIIGGNVRFVPTTPAMLAFVSAAGRTAPVRGVDHRLHLVTTVCATLSLDQKIDKLEPPPLRRMKLFAIQQQCDG